MTEPLIDAERVVTITKDCLVNEDTRQPDDDILMVEGVAHTYAFVPAKLEEHRAEVVKMLQGLPLAFRESTRAGAGGGWSFLNACQDANDEQWTGMHMTVESLLCLGIGLDLAEWCLPKEMWSLMPGGMPYVVVKV